MPSPPTRRRPQLAVLGVSLALAACGPAPDSDAEVVLARYGGGEITQAELDDYVARQATAGRSLTDGEGDWRRTALEEIAVLALAVDSAPPDDAALQAAIARARESILESAMRERSGWTELSVSPETVRAYYDEHPEVFVDPEKLRLQHIFLRAESESMSSQEREAVRRRLADIRQQILSGADFSAMAKRHSDSADGPAGGWMLLKSGAPVVRSFTDTVWALETDEVSEPIDTPAGFHIVRMVSRIAPIERPFEDVSQFAAEEALKVARRRLEQDYLVEVGARYELQRYYEALEDSRIEDDTVLFALDGETYTVGRLVVEIPESYRSHVYSGYLEYVHRFLDHEALRRLLVREAVAAGLEGDAAVQRQIETATTELRASSEIERRLWEKSAAIPDAELRDFYEQNKNRYETLRQRSVSVIRLPLARNENLWELLKEGERLVAEIRGGADFATLARRVSVHVSAATDGKLIDQTDDDLRVRVQGRARGRQVIDDLEPGEVSEPFVGEVYDPHTLRFEPTGVYIVRLDDETPPRQAPFEEVEAFVRPSYLRRFYTRFLSELKQEMLAAAEFEIIAADLPESGD